MAVVLGEELGGAAGGQLQGGQKGKGKGKGKRRAGGKENVVHRLKRQAEALCGKQFVKGEVELAVRMVNRVRKQGTEKGGGWQCLCVPPSVVVPPELPFRGAKTMDGAVLMAADEVRQLVKEQGEGAQAGGGAQQGGG